MEQREREGGHDTSAIIAVVTNEPHKERIIELTDGVDLIAPGSLRREVGNAFSAMFKRNRTSLERVLQAVGIMRQIPVRTVDARLDQALDLASKLQLYAYDAYMLCASKNHHGVLLTLDGGPQKAARRIDVEVMEVEV